MKKLFYLTFIGVFISCNNNKSSQMEESDYDSICVMVDDKDEDEFIGYKLKSNERIVSNDGFQWIEVKDEENKYVGAKDISGDIIIPLSKHFTDIRFYSKSKHTTEGYFHVFKDEYAGLYTMDGEEIIPTGREYNWISFIDLDDYSGYFEVSKECYVDHWEQYDELKGICDLSGKEIYPCSYASVWFEDGAFVLMKPNTQLVYTNKSLDSNGYVIAKSNKSSGSYQTSMPCPCCNGTGNFMGQFCNGCGGSGTIYYTVNSGDVPVSTSVPVTSGISNSGNTQSHNNRDNYLGERCRVCEGDGDEIVNVWMGSEVSDYCEKCRKTFDYMHYHRQCQTCGGQGSY